MYITFPLQHKINKKSKCLQSLSPPAEERSSERGLEISAPAKTRDEREGEWKSEREREDPCETETGWITWISGGSHAWPREWIDRSLESLLATDRAIGFAVSTQFPACDTVSSFFFFSFFFNSYATSYFCLCGTLINSINSIDTSWCGGFWMP